MSHCRKRCKRQLTKVARYFYRFLTGTLTQVAMDTAPALALSWPSEKRDSLWLYKRSELPTKSPFHRREGLLLARAH
ncbi:hypothetical protein AOLI_G00190260 [Acnodon oligacanthus]